MLKDIINWVDVMKQPRCVDTQEKIMDNLFVGATILACHVDDTENGVLGYVYQLEDEKIVLSCVEYIDCSCSTDDDVRDLCVQLTNESKIFDTVSESMNFLRRAIVHEIASNRKVSTYLSTQFITRYQ